MQLVRPRLTDFHGVQRSQEALDFAIPFLDEDIPLYVDPFLLWKSPSMQDQSLHRLLIDGFDRIGQRHLKGDTSARDILIQISECREVGLGTSSSRTGRKISKKQAGEILACFSLINAHTGRGFSHIETIPLLVDGISKDRISDFTCSFIKSFLSDFTYEQCEKNDIPMEKTDLHDVYDYRNDTFNTQKATLPCNPKTGAPILLIPKRWLRFTPWLNFDDYFSNHCPQDDVVKPGQILDRVSVLNFNQQNYGLLESYIAAKERTAEDCANDPLFKQIPVTSAKRHLNSLKKLPTGTTSMSDKKYEDNIVRLLSSMLYPHLDFAEDQSRTDSGAQIRDLIFYNNNENEFLKELNGEYGCRQIVFEIKNVKALEREHINQLNRYMTDSFGRFGVIVTRNRPAKARMQNIIDLWSGQRRCIVVLTDEDIAQMVELFESKQREPIDVIKKKYAEFRRSCPA